MLAFFVALGVFTLFFIFIALRVILGKDEEVRGTCASSSPFAKREGGACPTCGKPPEEACPNVDKEI
ncbi:MAG: hypothetical protein MK193_10195 [Lentisphaeria bacterium]|nr:hypothetical protein [Lentisphaeria bacterium]